MDEAGRGPLAGPVVAGAVLLHHPPRSVHIDDSKRLSALARIRAFSEISSSAQVGVGSASVDEIDQLGIHVATELAMLRALERLKPTVRFALIDGNHIPEGCRIPARAVVGGDARSLSVACASIVAKVVRDRWMGWVDRLHPEYHFAQHKGYGTQQHRQLIKRLGPSPQHRFSFRPIRAENESEAANRW